MSDTDLTAEEQAALEAMQSETTDTQAETTDPQPVEAEATDDRPDPVEEVEKAVESLEGKADEGEKDEPKARRAKADDAPPDGYVPHGALHAEREARKALQKQLEELQAWKQSQENPPEPEPQYVDPIEDPEGFKRYDEHRQKKLETQFEQFQQQQQRQAQQQSRLREAAMLEQEFAAKTPDYQNAAEHLHNARLRELQMQGYAQHEAEAQIAQDATRLFVAAKAIGMNPAQLLYMRAQEAGYTPQKPATPAPVPDDQRIEALANAQAQTRGVGSAGGSEQSGQLTAAQLANMSEAELAKVPDEVIARAMGA